MMGELRLLQWSVALTLAMLSVVGGWSWWTYRAPKPMVEWSRESRVHALIHNPRPAGSEAVLPYIWRLYDIYELQAGALKRRQEPLRQVSVGQILMWEHGTDNDQVQISSSPQFDSETIQVEAAHGQLEMMQSFLGGNFWRVSRDGRIWSALQSYLVEPRFLDADVRVRVQPRRLQFASATPMRGFVAEFSAQPDFSQVSVIWSSGSLPRPLHKKYVRVRGVDADGYLTNYSAVVTSP